MGALALLVAVGAASLPLASATVGRELLIGIALVALVSLALGLGLEWTVAIGGGIGLLGIQYTLSLLLEDATLDARAPLVAAALLCVAELSFWSIEQRAPVRDQPGVYLARARAVAALVAGGVILASVPLLVALAPLPRSLSITAMSAAAVVGVVLLLVALAARCGTHQA